MRRKYDPCTGKYAVNRNCPWASTEVGFTTQNFQSAIFNICKEPKQTMPKRTKGKYNNNVYQLGKTNKEMEIILKAGIMELKSTILKWKIHRRVQHQIWTGIRQKTAHLNRGQ